MAADGTAHRRCDSGQGGADRGRPIWPTATPRGPRLHMSKALREWSAHRKGFRTLLESDGHVSVTIMVNGGDGIEVHHRAAMNLHEHLRIELIEQALDGPVDQ